MSEIIYIGIKLIRISKEDSSKLEISDNAGISWSIVESGYIGEFLELAKNQQTLFAETSFGRFQSVTFGKTWTVYNWKKYLK